MAAAAFASAAFATAAAFGWCWRWAPMRTSNGKLAERAAGGTHGEPARASTRMRTQHSASPAAFGKRVARVAMRWRYARVKRRRCAVSVQLGGGLAHSLQAPVGAQQLCSTVALWHCSTVAL